jgi:SAM-dependent methyltransferase
MASNEVERRRWNDERWYLVWPKRERFTNEVTGYLLDALAPAPGERIFDIGSGGGTATLAAAAAVGDDGSVVGVDISASLCRLAAERATAAGTANVRFEVADVQTEAIAGAPFDAAMSQFGVMFFNEPVTAFRNIHAQLHAGGRIAFACWQPAEANPWFYASALAGFVPPTPQPEPGKSATGPFTLADPEHTTGILEHAGFANIRRTPYELETVAPEDTVVDEDQLLFLGVTDDQLPAASDAVSRHLSRFRIDDQYSRFPLAFQIYTASKP